VFFLLSNATYSRFSNTIIAKKGSDARPFIKLSYDLTLIVNVSVFIFRQTLYDYIGTSNITKIRTEMNPYRFAET
jgi:hypothetical protein